MMPGTYPTDDAITAALESSATRDDSDPPLWRWKGGPWHSDGEARVITRFCLILGCPVSDVLRSTMFEALLNRVVAIERLISRERIGSD